VISFLGPLLLFVIYVVFVASLSHTAGDVALWRKAAWIALTVRLGIFWGRLLLHWRGALGLWATPLILLLLPEGFLLPRDFTWTLPRVVFVTGLLAVGTAVWTALAVGVVRRLRPSSVCR
jgi:hypothetical protein